MGFRCPVCHEDFGIDKLAFMSHIENCSDGFAKDVVDLTTTGHMEGAKIYAGILTRSVDEK